MPDDAQISPTTADDEDLYRDFDEAVESLRKVRFKAGGREYDLPSEPPAKEILVWIKTGRLKDGKLSDPGDVQELFELFMGKTVVQQMLDDGVGFARLGEIAQWLASVYNLDKIGVSMNGDGEDADNPQSASARSSKSSRSSRPTSGGSTKRRR